MPITLPDKKGLRMTTLFREPHNAQSFPLVAELAMVSPGPIAMSANSPSPAGQGEVILAAGLTGRRRFVGINLKPDVPAGGAVEHVKGCIIEGWAGMTPGESIYVDDTFVDGGTASGLTHTIPANTGHFAPIGVAISATKAIIF